MRPCRGGKQYRQYALLAAVASQKWYTLTNTNARLRLSPAQIVHLSAASHVARGVHGAHDDGEGHEAPLLVPPHGRVDHVARRDRVRGL